MSKYIGKQWSKAANFHQTGRILRDGDAEVAIVSARATPFGVAASHLIAAAPDMFWMLARVQAVLANNYAFPEIVEEVSELLGKAEGLPNNFDALKVIARAEGKE